jgi:hypothetical protein
MSVQERGAESCMLDLYAKLTHAGLTFIREPNTQTTFKKFNSDCQRYIATAEQKLLEIKAPELSRLEKISNSIVKVLVEIGKALGMVNKKYEPTLFKAARNTVKEKFENTDGSSIKERLLNEKGVLPEIGKHFGPKGGGQ